MRPRVYDSYAEQKVDERIGFILFPIVNLVAWVAAGLMRGQISRFDLTAGAANMRTLVVVLPWLVNGLVLAWALIFRWHIGTGYLISLAWLGATGLGMGLLLELAYLFFSPLLALFGLIGLAVTLLVLLAILIWYLVKMIGVLRRWWRV